MEKYTLTEADEIRLLSKYAVDGDCWRWTGGYFQSTGYGIFNVKMSDGVWRPTTSHRAMYVALVGPIPAGFQIDHLCRNRACCNPSHLEAVPPRTNVLRSTSPAAFQAIQTHCIRGHEFTPENTYSKPGTNKRECRICMRARDNRRDRKGYVPPCRQNGYPQSMRKRKPST
jgi:hypothetical protein